MTTGGFSRITKEDVEAIFPEGEWGKLFYVDGIGKDKVLNFMPQKRIDEIVQHYGLEVLRANPSCDLPSQHGWSDLYVPYKKLGLARRYKTINAIRHVKRGEDRLYFYNLNLIEEMDVYAWFYDLVWRQNNNTVIIKDENGNRKAIDDYSGRWNRKKPFGYQVRKRLRNVLEKVENTVLLTLTISREKIEKIMPRNTNLDAVMFSIANMGEWVSNFNTQLWKKQKKEGIPWAFKGWVLEFQTKFNKGFPHVHIIFESVWMGKIQEIQGLWKYGIVDINTKKDVQKRYPDRKIEGLHIANYLTKYLTKVGNAVTNEGVHKGYAWLAFTGGRVFSVRHKKIPVNQENKT